MLLRVSLYARTQKNIEKNKERKGMEWKTARFDIFMYAFLRSLYRCTLCELLCVRGSDPGEREIKVGTLSAVRRSINRCFQNEFRLIPLNLPLRALTCQRH